METNRLMVALISCLLLCAPFGVGGNAPPQRVSRVPLVVTKTKGGSSTPSSKAISQRTAVAAGMILAFNSGYTNGCCLGGGVVAGQTKNAVVAVTGAWTTSALGLAGGNMAAFSAQAKGILSYLSGSCIAGLMIPRPKPFVVSDNAGSAFLIGAALMVAASQMAEKSPSTMGCFYLALMANGLQNSVTSVHTSNLCRSTHFTGITGDMGTFLGQCLRGNKENLFKLKVFFLLGLSFWLGSYSSFFITQHLTSQSLLFSAAVHFMMGCYLLLRKPDLSHYEKPRVLEYNI